MKNNKSIERDWLYEEIWKRPATKIAADLGISSSMLKRICDAMNIPTPQVGYWQKLEYGKKVKKPRLPELTENTKTSWTIDHDNSQSQKAQKQKVAELREAVAKLPELPISTDLDDLHSLVKSTRAQIREDAKDLAWDKCKDRRRINAQVSLGALDRTCLLLDTFVRGCEAAGYKFKSEADGTKPKKRSSRHLYPYERPDEPSGICWIEVDDERIEFYLREKNKRVYLPEEKQSWYRKYDEVPSSMLECSLGGAYHSGGRTNWRDGKVQRIEKLIPMMIAELPVIAKAKKTARDRRARQERRWQYDRKLWDFKDHRTRLQEEALQKLVEHSSEHRSANVARQYYEAVKEQLCSQHGSEEANDNMEAWIKWAEQAIADMDPVQRSTPPWEHDSFQSMLNNLKLDPPTPPDED